MEPTPTQTAYPWRATLRTIFQALLAFSAMWAVIVEALGLDPSWQWVAASLTVTGAITRLMAVPAVEDFFKKFLPFLSAEPRPKINGQDAGFTVPKVAVWVAVVIVVVLLFVYLF